MASKKQKPKALTKAQWTAELAEKTGLTKTQIQSVIDAESAVVKAELKAGHPVNLPGLVKITLQQKAATPARQGINPFTKEAITIKAKPARKVVRVRALKALKDMV